MDICLIDENTVKVVLYNEDLKEMDITYNELDYEDQYTRNLISALLQQVSSEADIDLSQGNLYIEAFPYFKGGCVLYINILNKEYKTRLTAKKHKNSLNAPLIFKFDSLELLSDCCKHMFRQFSHLIIKSSVYRYKKAYYLVLYTYYKLDKKVASVMSEFGKSVGKSEVKHSFYKEHGTAIADENAIEKMVEYC